MFFRHRGTAGEPTESRTPGVLGRCRAAVAVTALAALAGVAAVAGAGPAGATPAGGFPTVYTSTVSIVPAPGEVVKVYDSSYNVVAICSDSADSVCTKQDYQLSATGRPTTGWPTYTLVVDHRVADFRNYHFDSATYPADAGVYNRCTLVNDQDTKTITGFWVQFWYSDLYVQAPQTGTGTFRNAGGDVVSTCGRTAEPLCHVRDLLIMGTTVTPIAAGPDNAHWELFSLRLTPGARSPLHTLTADKVFAVTAGVVRLTVGDQVEDVAAGGYAHIPAGTAHSYLNASDADAAMIGFVAGSSGQIEFLRGMSALSAHGRPDPSALAEHTARHGVQILTPAG